VTAVALAPAQMYVAVQTAIGVTVNLVLGALFTILNFGDGQAAFWGFGGLAFDFVPATFVPVAGMTIGLTLATRAKRRTGKAPSLAGGPLPLPRNLLLRAGLFAAGSTLALGGIGLAALTALWTPSLDFQTLLAFKLAYAALVALVMTPLITVAALRDRIAAH